MATTPLDRLLFAQGGACFFCRHPIPRTEASVEHLVAITNGGSNDDENCVACCKSLNRLLGRMSLKEKLNVVLNQTGNFNCPGNVPASKSPVAKPGPQKVATQIASKKPAAPLDTTGLMAFVVEDLHRRGSAKPGSIEKLTNTAKAVLQHKEQPAETASAVVLMLQKLGYVVATEGKISEYRLPPRK